MHDFQSIATVLQADEQVVIHHHDLDLLQEIDQAARRSMETRCTRGAFLHELPDPIQAVLVTEWECNEDAQKFTMAASTHLVQRGEVCRIDPRGYDCDEEAEAIRRILLKSTLNRN